MNEKLLEGKKYNGWANYETWVVSLWLDNDEGSYRYWRREARLGHAAGLDAHDFGRQIREEIEDGSPLHEPSLYADLLGAALAEVDWSEIAEARLDEFEDEDDEGDWTEAGGSCDGGPTPDAAPLGRDARPGEEPERDANRILIDELLSVFTRAQAIEDGVLVDVSETAREAGFRIPVALTRGVWGKYVAVPEGVRCQDEQGRLWDVVCMARYGIARAGGQTSPILFKLYVRNSNEEEPQLITLKAVCGPSDDETPCITLMLPDED